MRKLLACGLKCCCFRLDPGQNLMVAYSSDAQICTESYCLFVNRFTEENRELKQPILIDNKITKQIQAESDEKRTVSIIRMVNQFVLPFNMSIS